MGTLQNQTREYAAFISYAHADEAMAARLHKALETYPVPKHLRGQGKTTKPVFRDVAELTAAHSLSEKIRDAVKGSRVLIVLCSPAAKASHWVNEEIRLFRELHGDAAILSAIIKGTPETAFPAALVEGGREPLAAALGADKAGFKLGVTQLAAGMLGTGLDDLIQRGAKRRNRIMGAGLAASLALSGVMGFTAFQAVEARNEAQTARAEAEGLVEYMIKDLKFKLEPVGRLDLLQGIGDKAVEYYDKQDLKDLNDASLNRQAAARQVLAQVHLDAGRMEEAQREIEASASLTREVLARNPNDTDAIFAHAQSAYWVGQYYRRQGKLSEMEKPWREYDRLAQILYKKDPENFDWVMEAAWGKNSLGIWSRELSNQNSGLVAIKNYTQAIDYFEEALLFNPESKLAQVELANAMSGKSQLLLAFDTQKSAQIFALEYLTFLTNLVSEYPNDTELKRKLYLSQLDYYNGYFLELEKHETLLLSLALDKLFKIVESDLENTKNITFFMQAVCNSYESYKLKDLELRHEQFKKLLGNLQKNSGVDLEYYQLMSEVFFIKIDILEGEKKSAFKKLKNLEYNYFNKNNKSADDWKLIYSMFLQYRDLSYLSGEKKFSNLFITEMNDRSKLEYPTILFQKLQANLALGDCKSAMPLAQKLEARGYLDGLDLDLNPCQSL